MKRIRRLARLVVRLFLMGLVFAGAGLEQLFWGGWRWSPKRRAKWLQRWSSRFLKFLGFRLAVQGRVPSGGFIAPNHLSYVDIIVLASLSPQVFLSKSEVRSWPVIGWYTRMAGTLFIDRGRRSDVANKESEFEKVLAAGLSMTFFLEGTSTNGAMVLPFRSSLLQPLVKNGWQITPAYIRYACVDGDPANDVCWWGDMGFGSHLFRMLQVKRIDADLVFGEPQVAASERKLLADQLFKEVCELSNGLGVEREELS